MSSEKCISKNSAPKDAATIEAILPTVWSLYPILNFGNSFSYDLIQIANSLRKSNINTEFYPDSVSLKKQLNYANKNMIPYVLFYGEEEKENLYFNLKDMNSGNQQKLSKDQLLKVLVEN